VSTTVGDSAGQTLFTGQSSVTMALWFDVIPDSHFGASNIALGSMVGFNLFPDRVMQLDDVSGRASVTLAVIGV